MRLVKGKGSINSIRTKVRILFVAGFVADTYCEIEQSYVELCTRPGHDIEFLWLVPTITWKHNNFAKPENRTALDEPVFVSHLRKNGIPFIVGNVSKYNIFANLLLFWGIFQKHRVDAVYTHFGYERFWATFLGKLLGRVTIWTEHWHSLGMRYSFAKKIFYRIFVDEFIAVSRFVENTLPNKSHVHSIPNAIRVDAEKRLSSKQASEFRERLGIREVDQVVLMVAQFTPQKRHLLALEVCQIVFRECPDAFFIFLGEGRSRVSFLEKASDIGLGNRIVAPGYVNDVDNYYSIADVSMLTSYNEGFGYAVLEAMRYGLPVVAFETGAPAEVIQNRVTGVLVQDGQVTEFAQEICELIGSKQLRTSIGEMARQAVEQHYNREIWIVDMKLLLRRIITEYRR